MIYCMNRVCQFYYVDTISEASLEFAAAVGGRVYL